MSVYHAIDFRLPFAKRRIERLLSVFAGILVLLAISGCLDRAKHALLLPGSPCRIEYIDGISKQVDPEGCRRGMAEFESNARAEREDEARRNDRKSSRRYAERQKATQPLWWARHVQQAKLDERASSRTAPLAWLNGAWCNYDPQKKHLRLVEVFHVLGPNHISSVRSYPGEIVYRVERQGDVFVKYQMSTSFRLKVVEIRKDNQDQFTQVWQRQLKKLKGPDWSRRTRPHYSTFQRCTAAELASPSVRDALKGVPHVQPNPPEISEIMRLTFDQAVAKVRE